LRPNKIYRHVLGKPQESDELVYEETDETFTVGLKNRSRKIFFL
jgi:oligopeptidase B